MSLLPENYPKPVDAVQQIKLDVMFNCLPKTKIPPESVEYSQKLTAALLEQWAESGAAMRPQQGKKRSYFSNIKIPSDLSMPPEVAADLLVNECLTAMGFENVVKMTMWEAFLISPYDTGKYGIVIRVGDVELSST